MRKLFLITASVLLTACMKNFSPDEAKTAGVTLRVNIPVQEDNIHDMDSENYNLSVSAYCYDDSGNIVERKNADPTYHDSFLDFRFIHLDKSKEYSFLLIADFYFSGDHDSKEKIWFHLLTGSLESFHIRRVTGSRYFYDTIKAGYTTTHPDNSMIDITLSDLGVPCNFTYNEAEHLTAAEYTFTGLYQFSPIGNNRHDYSTWYKNSYLIDTVEDTRYDYLYIIPDESQQSEFTVKLYTSASENPIESSVILDLSKRKPLDIKINCSNGEITWSEKS